MDLYLDIRAINYWNYCQFLIFSIIWVRKVCGGGAKRDNAVCILTSTCWYLALLHMKPTKNVYISSVVSFYPGCIYVSNVLSVMQVSHYHTLYMHACLHSSQRQILTLFLPVLPIVLSWLIWKCTTFKSIKIRIPYSNCSRKDISFRWQHVQS